MKAIVLGTIIAIALPNVVNAGTWGGSTWGGATWSNGDVIKPSISAFAIPATSVTATVPITTLSASDNVGIVGYYLSSSATAPTATAAGWSATKPVSYTFTGLTAGVATAKTLYVWVKDTGGNVSALRSASTTITLDKTLPVISAFALPATSTSATVAVSITASDNVGVAGYYLSTYATAPTAATAGWSVTKPVSYTFTGLTAGVATAKTLNLWVKDTAGNVSALRSASTTITLDKTLPTITTFAIPATSTSATVAVSITASDNVGVAGYYLSTYATAPTAATAGWSTTKPVSYTFTGLTAGVATAKTLNLWVKDPAGNVSASKSASTTITVR